jgi:phosphoenolpyruvate carboxykinase (ATP)
MATERLFSSYGLDRNGITNVRKVHWNHNTPLLYEDIIKNREGHVTHKGPVVTRTGLHTGRAARDKFIVEEDETREHIWWGEVNKPIAPQAFENMFRRLQAYLQDRDVWVQDCFAGADPRYRMPIRVITVRAWHSLFARNMFIQAEPHELSDHVPDFTVIHAPSFQAIPEVDGTNSEAFILLNLRRKLVLIGGTSTPARSRSRSSRSSTTCCPSSGCCPCTARQHRPDGDTASSSACRAPARRPLGRPSAP